MRTLSFACLLVAALSTIGCTVPPPRAEVEAYRGASSQAMEATRSLAVALAPMERVQGRGSGDPASPGFIFDPERAAYYSNVGHPPLVRRLLAVADVVEAYNEMLMIYAEGKSWQLAQPRVRQLQGLATTLDAMAPMDGGQAVQLALTLAKIGRQATDRQRFRALVEEHSDDVLTLLDHLRKDVSPHIDNILKDHADRRQLARLAEPSPDAARDHARYRAMQVEALADWVVMLQSMEESLKHLQDAVAAGPSETTSGALLFWTNQLAQATAEFRGTLTALDKI